MAAKQFYKEAEKGKGGGKGGMDQVFDIPGPKAKARHRIIAVVTAVLTLAAVGWMVLRFKEKGNLDADKWTPFLTADIWVNYLIPGLINTIKAALRRCCSPASSASSSVWVGSRTTRPSAR